MPLRTLCRLPQIFHLNHGYSACTPGAKFDLIPIVITADSPWSEDYEAWRQAFPDGVSLFGLRHMTPDHPFEPVPLEKAKLEHRCESVRRDEFPQKLSRFQAFFGLSSLEEATVFRELTRETTGITGSIWTVEVEQVHHRGDMRLLVANPSDAGIRAYWQGLSLDGGRPIWECLVRPPVTIIEAV
jgi:hypothetical protein